VSVRVDANGAITTSNTDGEIALAIDFLSAALEQARGVSGPY
jgi:hypothetical protein